jgi:hypothetical protein
MSISYSIEYLAQEKIICISVIGKMDFHIAEKYSKRALTFALKKNCNKFIFDHRFTLFPGSLSKFHTSEDELQQFGFSSSDKIAIVMHEQRDGSKIKEKLTRNKSWSILKYFYGKDKSQAINWLSINNN